MDHAARYPGVTTVRMEAISTLQEAEAQERQSEAAVRLFQATVEAAVVVQHEG